MVFAVLRGTPADLLTILEKRSLKGEFVVMVEAGETTPDAGFPMPDTEDAQGGLK